jgi:hypothetical protein
MAQRGMNMMNIPLEHFLSRKLGTAFAAMILIANLGPEADPAAAWLITCIAMVHIVCQTVLDVRNGRGGEGAEDLPALTKDGLLVVDAAEPGKGP